MPRPSLRRWRTRWVRARGGERRRWCPGSEVGEGESKSVGGGYGEVGEGGEVEQGWERVDGEGPEAEGGEGLWEGEREEGGRGELVS